MKRVWHIAWKDLRRLRAWWLVWLAVLLLPILHGLAVLHAPPASAGPADWNAPGLQQAFFWVEVAIAYLLVLLIFEGDPVAGTRAFWQTRPIAWWRLLAAKLLSGAIAVWLVPMVVLLPWWLWCGFGPVQIVGGATTVLVIALRIATPAAMIAALTGAFARSLLWTAVLVAAVACVATMNLLLMQFGGTAAHLQRFLLVAALWWVEMALVLLVRFAAAMRVWPLYLALGVAVVSGAAAIATPVRVATTELADRNPERAAQVSVRFLGLTQVGSGTAPRTQTAEIEERLEVAYPPGSPVVGLRAQLTWKFAGEPLTRQSNWLFTDHRFPVDGLQEVRPDPEFVAWRKVHRPSWQRAPAEAEATQPGAVVLHVRTWLSEARLARIRGEHPPFSARTWFTSVTPRLAAEVPVVPGATGRSSGRKLWIRDVEHGRDEATAKLVTFEPAIISGPVATLSRAASGGFDLVAVNRSRHEYRIIDSAFRWALTIDGVRITSLASTVHGGMVIQNDRPALRPGWVDGATIALPAMDIDAVFHRDVFVPASDVAAGTGPD